MFLPHIVDLHPGERTKGKSLLDSQSRIIRMNMYFDHIIIRYNDNGITDRFQVSFEFMFRLLVIFFFQIYDKFGAVAKLNVKFFGRRCSLKRCLCPGAFHRQIHFLSGQPVQTAF